MPLTLVITADDLGIDVRRDEGIAHTFRAGGITQASLLVTGPSAAAGARLARAIGLPLGLHLDLTETPPAAAPERVRSLLDRSGAKLGKHGLRDALARGQIDLADVERETHAQIDAFRALVGEPPRHVDGHQHAHAAPELTETLARVFAERGVATTRIPAQREVQVDDPGAAAFYRQVSEDGERARAVFARHGIVSTEAFVGLDLMGFAMSAAALVRAVRGLGEASSAELMCHPGFVGEGWDDFNRSPAREHELSVLAARPLAALVSAGEVALASFASVASLASIGA